MIGRWDTRNGGNLVIHSPIHPFVIAPIKPQGRDENRREADKSTHAWPFLSHSRVGVRAQNAKENRPVRFFFSC